MCADTLQSKIYLALSCHPATVPRRAVGRGVLPGLDLRQKPLRLCSFCQGSQRASKTTSLNQVKEMSCCTSHLKRQAPFARHRACCCWSRSHPLAMSPAGAKPDITALLCAALQCTAWHCALALTTLQLHTAWTACTLVYLRSRCTYIIQHKTLQVSENLGPKDLHKTGAARLLGVFSATSSCHQQHFIWSTRCIVLVVQAWKKTKVELQIT